MRILVSLVGPMRMRIEYLPILGVVRDEHVAFRSDPPSAEPRLEEADRPGAHLVAHCRCGWEQRIDPRTWLNQGQGWRRLSDLSSRLRCLCGARHVALTIRAGDPPPAVGNRVYIWR